MSTRLAHGSRSPSPEAAKKRGPFRGVRKSVAKATGLHGVFSGKRADKHRELAAETQEPAPEEHGPEEGASPVTAAMSSPERTSAKLATQAAAVFGAAGDKTAAAPGSPETSAMHMDVGEAMEMKEAAALETAEVAAERIEVDGAAGAVEIARTPVQSEKLQFADGTLSPLMAASAKGEELAEKARDASPTMDVGKAPLGGASAADIVDIRVNPMGGGCLGGKGSSFAIMVPSRLCAALSEDAIPAEYVSVVHSYKEFVQLDRILTATAPVGGVPPLPAGKSASCFVCGGSVKPAELAPELRDYLAELLSLPSNEVASIKAPLAGFFGVADEL